MSRDSGSNDNETWSDSVKHHTVWFVLAVVIGLGSSYIAVEVNIARLQSNVAVAQDDIESLEEMIEESEDVEDGLKLQVVRLEEKIDLLLRSEGINPNEVRQ